MTNRDYQVGDAITVPWGLDLVQGTVVGAYGEGLGLRVLVEVDLGDGGTEVLPFPPRALELAQQPEGQGPPGAWVQASRYEESLSRVLGKILHAHAPEWPGGVEMSARLGETREIDFLAQLPDRLLLIEAKHYRDAQRPLNSSTLDQMVAYLRRPQRNNLPAVALVVTNAKVPLSVVERAEEYRKAHVPLWVAGWREWDTPVELEMALTEALRFPVSG
ncbi:hypothetical protein ABZV29_12810 [Streptomyces sp. NPDC005236]|uniref:hypothetical protein n=1 Tax=Streptomyces sp. NPDC005236 TaxID=3157028 RepID=UPI0033B37FBA